MNQFNLSLWALKNKSLILLLVFLTFILGVIGYLNLSQSEDPPFTVKTMVVTVAWPGATAAEMEQQVVDQLELIVSEVPFFANVNSAISANEATLFVTGKEEADAREAAILFYEVRKRIEDMAFKLPEGVLGPFFNDNFGDTFGNIYALVGEDYSLVQLRDKATEIRKEFLLLPDVTKILPIGVQNERITIEIDNKKIEQLNINKQQLLAAIAGQNEMVPEPFYDNDNGRVYIRSKDKFASLDDLRQLPLQINKETVRLKDVANISRGFEEPATASMHYQGLPAIGIGVSMNPDGDIIRLGKDLDKAVARIRQKLPNGMKLERVNDQPRTVSKAIKEFLVTVSEAVFIVLLVSFFSLGLRAGAVVALSIPVVLAGTFYLMSVFDVGLHKISLGALILALGLLVDDAIIAVDMMSLKLEQGMSRFKAAGYAYMTTAFPMLTGTLVTVAGFLPIALADSSTGEYTRSIFQVVAIALVLSWFSAVILVPYLGSKLLLTQAERAKKFRIFPDINFSFFSKFIHYFKRFVLFCILHPAIIIVFTFSLLALAGFGFMSIQQQFFPSSIRPELLVDIKLPEGASIQQTKAETKKMETYLGTQSDQIDNFASYIGRGSPRFYLPLDEQLPDDSFAQIVVTAKDLEARETLRNNIISLMESATFSQVRLRALRLENGPPVGYPVQFRISGEKSSVLRTIANKVASAMKDNEHLENVHLDWGKSNRIIKLTLDTDKAGKLGITQANLNQALGMALNGLPIGEFRDAKQAITIVLKDNQTIREKTANLKDITLPTANGVNVLLTDIATLEESTEDGVIMRNDRLQTITVRGDIYDDIQAPTVSAQVQEKLVSIKNNLPLGYKISVGGAEEESDNASASIMAVVPIFVTIMLLLLMVQLQSFVRLFMVLLTAPFGFIGVVGFLLLFDQPFGFVALLGSLALSGMIMRNSIILVDQIDRNIATMMIPARAVILATLNRFRPIILTALATILAMIPLTSNLFFAPMAVSIMGGLSVATLLTLFFLPAMYSAWFRYKYGTKVFFGKEKMSVAVAMKFRERYKDSLKSGL
ncbi:MAG: efflux RND transporter permease subunit [Cocleimonas sp.]|nr:efflux RND transporter permease subunit [Cocleimonas sp.]